MRSWSTVSGRSCGACGVGCGGVSLISGRGAGSGCGGGVCSTGATSAGLSTAGHAAAGDVLGYRGLLISQIGEWPLRSARVRDGIVSMEESGATRHYRDTENIERWLLEKARAQGYGALVDEILKGFR